MPKFRITEIQRVLAVREVEAADEDLAYELFCDGEGLAVDKDGDVSSSDLISIEELPNA